MGLIAVQMSINPFELFMLAAVAIIGVIIMLGLAPPTALRHLLPDFLVYVWATNLGLGGACGLIGGLWSRHLDRGLAAYQFGWGLVGVGTLVYGIALLVVFKAPAIGPGVQNVLFALACFTRVIQVQRFFALSAAVIKRDASQRSRP